MATYSELYSASSDADLIAKITVAVAVAAEGIRTEDPATPLHSERLAWAFRALANPEGEARKIIWALLAQNKDAPPEQIAAVSDTAIQNGVASSLDILAR